MDVICKNIFGTRLFSAKLFLEEGYFRANCSCWFVDTWGSPFWNALLQKSRQKHFLNSPLCQNLFLKARKPLQMQLCEKCLYCSPFAKLIRNVPLIPFKKTFGERYSKDETNAIRAGNEDGKGVQDETWQKLSERMTESALSPIDSSLEATWIHHPAASLPQALDHRGKRLD